MQEHRKQKWVNEEFGEAGLSDGRQVKRLRKMAEDFYAMPQASINEASRNWAASKAAYRFLDSEIDADMLLEAHRQRTLERMKGLEVVLAIQDTTTLNFTTQRAKRGMGGIGTKKSENRGFFCHETLMVDTEGIALGVLDVQSYRRVEQPVKRRRQGQATERESGRWLRSLESCQRAALSSEGAPQIVSVADREADFYEFFAHGAKEASAVEILVRAQHDRELEEGKLFARLAEQNACGYLEVEVPGQDTRAKRRAKLAIRFLPLRMRAPAHWQAASEYPALKLWAIEAREVDQPPGQDAICWRLLTTLPVHNFAQAVQKVRWYTLRWKIEVFHKILKSGCKIEERQLETLERMERVLRIDVVIAWRILFLMTQGRAHPQICCTVLLEDFEWKALHGFVNKGSPAARQPPTLGEAVLWIAKLGGFLARKGDGRPGATVLWRGLAKLDTLSQAWLAFSPS